MSCRRVFIFLITVLVTGPGWSQETGGGSANAWTPRDTRNANHYIRLLDEEPDYGNVLDILWQLYQRHDAVPLLLQSYARNAEESGRMATRIVYAHLLRKKGDLERARAVYDAVLAEDSANSHALAGHLEVCRALEDIPAAIGDMERFVELAGDDGEKAKAYLQLGQLYQENADAEKAAAAWKKATALVPEDADLRQTVVHFCMGAGLLEEAIGHGEALTRQSDPEKRIAAMGELARLHEFADRFEAARDTLQEALDKIHFRHWLHEEFFARLVRLHERFERLEELEKKLLDAAEATPPQEAALFRAVRFGALTLRPQMEEDWLRRLVGLLAEQPEYRLALIRRLLENERYEEAADRLEILLADTPAPPLDLHLLRCEIDLKRDNRGRAADRLLAYLGEHSRLSPEDRGRLLEFCRDAYLDPLTETLLRENAKAAPDNEAGVFALARFFFQRRKPDKGKAVLQRFVDRSGDAGPEQARRLDLVAEVLRGAGHLASAADSVQRSMEVAEPGRERYLRLGEVYAEQHNTELALEFFEEAVRLAENYEQRIDVDERIFAMLQQHIDESPDPVDASDTTDASRVLEQILTLPSVPVVPGETDKEPESPQLTPVDVFGYYRRLAAEGEAGSLEDRMRRAWWAFRIGDYAEAYPALIKLAEENPGYVPAAKLLLDLANASGNLALASKQLELLAELEPDQRTEYLRRRAEAELRAGNPDEALAILQPLRDVEDVSPELLETMARCYVDLDEIEQAFELLTKALEQSHGAEKRRLLDSCARLALQLRDTEGMLAVIGEVIREEKDPAQRQRLFENQLNQARRYDILETLLGLYEGESRRHPFDGFYLEALAGVHEALGQLPEAFRAMRRAYYVNGRPLNLLPSLRDLASATGDGKAAIYFQKQLIATPQNARDLSEWEKLLEMLEDDLRAEEAEKVRRRMERRFSQNVEILTRLADDYRQSKQFRHALRVQERLNHLRSWELSALYAEAILLEKTGRVREALEVFQSLLASPRQETDNASASGERASARRFYYPVAQWLETPRRHSDPYGFRRLESLELLDSDELEAVADTFRQRGKFYTGDPKSEPLVRLRAIEHTARLLRQQAEAEGEDDGAGRRLQAWKDRWSAAGPGGNPNETLWALFYCGEYAEARRFLPDAGGLSVGERFLVALLRLHMGLRDEWAGSAEDGASSGSLLLWCARAWLWRAAPDSVDGENLGALLRDVPLQRGPMRNLAMLLGEQGNYAEALILGERLLGMYRRYDEQPLWARQLAIWASFAGDSARQSRYLTVAMRQLESASLNSGRRVFEEAFLKKQQIIYDADEQEAFLRRTHRRLDGLPEDEALPSRAWVNAVTRNAEGAAACFQQFVGPRLVNGVALAARSTADQLDENETRYWEEIYRSTKYVFAERGMLAMARMLLEQAEAGDPLVEPPGSDPRASAANCRHLALIWEFEDLTYPEREARVRKLMGQFPSGGVKENLARALESYGYHREAIPLYAELLRLKPTNHTYHRGFIKNCREGLVYAPAVEYLQRVLGGETAAPDGMSGPRGHEMLAQFFRLQGDEPALVEHSDLPLALYDRRRVENPYLSELKNYYVDEERWTDAARVCERILRIRRSATLSPDTAEPSPLAMRQWSRSEDKTIVLVLGAAYENSGQIDKALELYDSVKLEGQNRGTEIELIRRVASLAATGKMAGRLKELAGVTANYKSIGLVLEVARRLAEVSERDAARSLLMMSARRAKDDASRFDVLLLLGELMMAEEDSTGVLDAVEPLFECGQENQSRQARFLQLLMEHGVTHRAAMLPFFRQRAANRERRALALLCQAALLPAGAAENAPEELAGVLNPWSEPAGAVSLTLGEQKLMTGILLEKGAAAEARALYETFLLQPLQASGVAQPLYLKILVALDDGAGVRAVHDRLVREDRSRSTLKTRMFAEQGFPGLARSLCHRYDVLLREEAPTDSGLSRAARQQFLYHYAELLTSARQFAAAEDVLRRAFHRGPGDEARLAALYTAWSPPGGWESRLRVFHLPAAVVERLRGRLTRETP